MSSEKKHPNRTRKGDDRDWVRSRMSPDSRIRDATVPDPEERKKIMFYDTAKRRTDLNIKLKYDNIKQSEFFRIMISGYLESDPYFLILRNIKKRWKYTILTRGVKLNN